jgi:hypothetical protein
MTLELASGRSWRTRRGLRTRRPSVAVRTTHEDRSNPARDPQHRHVQRALAGKARALHVVACCAIPVAVWAGARTMRSADRDGGKDGCPDPPTVPRPMITAAVEQSSSRGLSSGEREPVEIDGRIQYRGLAFTTPHVIRRERTSRFDASRSGFDGDCDHSLLTETGAVAL